MIIKISIVRILRRCYTIILHFLNLFEKIPKQEKGSNKPSLSIHSPFPFILLPKHAYSIAKYPKVLAALHQKQHR